VNIQVIKSLRDLDHFQKKWEALEGPFASPMQQFIWTRSCAETFQSAGSLHLIAIEDGEKTIAIAPLISRRSTGRLEFIGLAEMEEPMDCVYADQAAADTLAQAIRRQKCPLFLGRLPKQSLMVPALQKAYRGKELLSIRQGDDWPTVAIDNAWKEPEKHLNSGRRSDLRRAIRVAEQSGVLRYESIKPTPSNVDALLDQAYAVEEASWKGKQKSALSHDPVRGAFYRRYTKMACEKGVLRFYFLHIGGKPAAMQIVGESGHRLWLYKIGYDDQFARASPGNLLLRYVLADAGERGLDGVEFLGSVESWIRMWTKTDSVAVVVRGYPLGPTGCIALAKDLMGSAWRRFRW